MPGGLRENKKKISKSKKKMFDGWKKKVQTQIEDWLFNYNKDEKLKPNIYSNINKGKEQTLIFFTYLEKVIIVKAIVTTTTVKWDPVKMDVSRVTCKQQQ